MTIINVKFVVYKMHFYSKIMSKFHHKMHYTFWAIFAVGKSL